MVTTAVNSSADATPHSTPLPCSAGHLRDEDTPPTEAGTLPKASHFEMPMSTVPERQWRQPPSVLVSAP